MPYVLGALFIAIVVAIVISRVRSRKRQPGAIPLDTTGAGTSSIPRSSIPAVASLKDSFDPDATRIYAQPPVVSKSVSPKRESAPHEVTDKAHLVGLSGRQKGHLFPIAAPGIVVGRDDSCDVVLTDARVSLHHAWIGFVDGRVVLRDLQSTNGTFLNVDFHSSITEAELRPGDTIFFGGHQADQFRFVTD